MVVFWSFVIVALYLLLIPVVIIGPLLLISAHDRRKERPRPAKPHKAYRGPYDPKPAPPPAPPYLRRWTAGRKLDAQREQEQWEDDFNHVA